MDQDQACARDQRVTVVVGLRVSVSLEDYLGAQAPDRLDLDLRRGPGHDDDGPDAETVGGKGDPLRVVARARRDHPPFALLRGQMGHPVVRSSQLEAEDRLQVFPLQQDGVSQAARKERRVLERRRAGDVVNTACADIVKELVGRHGEVVGHLLTSTALT